MFIHSCITSDEKFNKIKINYEKVEASIEKIGKDLASKKISVPKLFIINQFEKDYGIRLYRNIELIAHLQHVRPKNDLKVFMCIPAAYTSKQNEIDGIFVENGKIISNSKNMKLNGGCILWKDKIEIIEMRDFTYDIKRKIERLKLDFFQQSLLLKNKNIISCNIFEKRKNIRRALIQYENSYCIAESTKPIEIFQFQNSLKKIGVVDAINLDMGTWSEGWYRNQNFEKIVIGESKLNSDKQTNWLIFYSL